MPYFTLLFLTTLSPSSATCNTYACGSLSSSCMTTVGSLITYDVTKCNSTSQCVTGSSGSGSCALSTDLQSLFPGRKCSSGWYCQSGVCTNGICVGQSLGATCTDSSYCNPGLFCNSTTSLCQTMRALGQSCSSGDQCTYYSGCNFGVCVSLYSLANGAALSSGNCDSSWLNQALCSSGMCFIKTDGSAVCGAATTYSKGDFVQCATSSDCGVTYAGITNYMPCLCGWNAAGTSYCRLTIGSSAGQAYLPASQSIYSSSTAKNYNAWELDLNIAMDGMSSSVYQGIVYKEYSWVSGAMLHNGVTCYFQYEMAAYYSAYSSYSFGEVIGIGILIGVVGW